jgi:hypothetical protein
MAGIEEAVKNCWADKVFYNPDNQVCDTNAKCPHKYAGNKCRKHGPRPRGETMMIRKTEQAAQVKPTPEQCALGSKVFLLGGACTADDSMSCKYKTEARFTGRSSNPEFKSRQFAKCIRYNLEACPETRVLYHKGVCLATGTAACPHQQLELMMPLVENGKEYAYCERFNV